MHQWIATVMGAGVVSASRVSSGASRATLIVDLADGRQVVARVDTGDGPMAGTELSLAREAVMYRALAGSGVKIPLSHGVSPDGTVLLLERASGVHDYAEVTRAAKHGVYDDYVSRLAELHNVDSAALDLPGFVRPTTGPEHAVAELDLWERNLNARTSRPWPLARFAFKVLRQLAPAHVQRTVVCHGDVGPGNFLHDGRRVTALLDWEFSHLGDPMDDLGWWVFRGHDINGDCGDLEAQFAAWSAATGLGVDRSAVAYYRVMVMLRWLVSVAAVVDNGGTGMDRSVHHLLIPTLGVLLPRGLAEITRHRLAPVPDPPVADEPLAELVVDTATADISQVLVPAASDPESKRRLGAQLAYLSHLASVDRLGASVRAGLHDAAGALLGTAPVSRAEADRVITEGLDRLDPGAVLDYFWTTGWTTAALWPPIAGRVTAPFTELMSAA
jgi:aminoglycoside phosphotransferase (APT) family kinase protein